MLRETNKEKMCGRNYSASIANANWIKRQKSCPLFQSETLTNKESVFFAIANSYFDVKVYCVFRPNTNDQPSLVTMITLQASAIIKSQSPHSIQFKIYQEKVSLQ